jgi:hypothetical protein
MKERIPENEFLLNQKSKEFLLLVKDPDLTPEYLYCLQLALWGAENGLEVDYQVKDSLYIMLGWEPEKLMNALEYTDPKYPEDWLDLLNGHNTPIDLAC